MGAAPGTARRLAMGETTPQTHRTTTPAWWWTEVRTQAIALGGLHTCALLDDATVACFGDNQFGQLGLDDLLDRNGARMIPGLANIGRWRSAPTPAARCAPTRPLTAGA